jgi:hypothetical protein
MALTAKEAKFLNDHRTAAMITVGEDGVAKAVRVGIVMVDGKLCSSGTESRRRTVRLRRDPRCTLFVFSDGYAALTLETTVTVLNGPDAARRNLKLFRVMQDRPSGPLSWFGGELDEAEFLTRMENERRLVYEFDIQRAYGTT